MPNAMSGSRSHQCCAVATIIQGRCPAVCSSLTRAEQLHHGEALQTAAQRMREAGREATRLTGSSGGGTSRVVATLAAGVAKPTPILTPGRSEGQTVSLFAIEVDRLTVQPSNH